MKLTINDFKQLKVAEKEAIVYLPYFNKYLDKFKINTPNRLIAFFSNLLHESNNFKNVVEIASGSAYEGSKALGNTNKGDGVKFKGRGLAQLTGRWNYTDFTRWNKKTFGDNVDFTNNPKLLETPKYAVLSAFYFWEFKKLELYADWGDFTSVASIWNTGREKSMIVNGMRDRVDKEKIIEKWLSNIVKKNV